MITRTLVLDTIQGDIDQAAAQAVLDEQNALAEINAVAMRETFVPDVLVCNVTLVLKDDAGNRLEMHSSNWSEVAGLAVGQTFTLTVA